MKLLVLDPRDGDAVADLFVVDEAGVVDTVRLGYVPELRHDPAAGEVVLVETELPQARGTPTRYWLKCYDADTLRLRRQVAIPERPMYAGFPGRSTRVAPTPSGRYVYFLQSETIIRFPDADDVFRLTVHRYDRHGDAVEPGGPAVESCMLDFGQFGAGDDEFYFHLSCDYPSTVAFGRFPAADLDWVRLEAVPPRTHCPQETCGSWVDREGQALYCVTGEGKVYELRRPPGGPRLVAHLPLAGGRSVPLHQLYGGGGALFVGVARDAEERGLGLASEVWQVSAAGAVVRTFPLPVPVINFVTTPDGGLLMAVDPYRRVLFVMDTRTGRVLKSITGFGVRPAELLLVP
jgi:hypothetical protein